jgi:hypothetical protein
MSVTPLEDYAAVLALLPDEWAHALRVVLSKARQMHSAGEDGQIVIVLKAGKPLTVKREDNTQIVQRAA